MDISQIEIVQKLTESGRGILAADESISTCEKRFSPYGIQNTEDNRRAYRDGLFGANIGKYLSGVILHEETLSQTNLSGKRFSDELREKNVLVGIKVDQGLENYEGSELEQVSLGLETLPVRLAEYKSQGALFTKWRTVYKISDSTPSESILNANATTLSEYARMVIDSGMVPIVEPEVLMDGTHDINKDRQVTYMVLKSLFQKMSEYQIDFSKVILKPNMVAPGSGAQGSATAIEIADNTLAVLQEVLPDNLGGVAFLSGGIQSDLAIEALRQINLRKTSHIRMTFSFARALQESFLSVWKGEESNIISARAAFDEKLGKVSLAVTIYT